MDELKIIKGNTFVDDRGYLRFINDFNFENVKRFYQVENHSAGYIRAWHGHIKEAKYVYVIKGSILLGAVPLVIKNNTEITLDKDNTFKTVISANTPSILYIPPKYANGFKTLEPGTIVQFFSTVSINEAAGDDYRFEHDIVDIWKENYR